MNNKNGEKRNSRLNKGDNNVNMDSNKNNESEKKHTKCLKSNQIMSSTGARNRYQQMALSDILVFIVSTYIREIAIKAMTGYVSESEQP